MKVLMIASWYPTPGRPLLGTFFKEQAEMMAAAGLDVAVIHVSVGSRRGSGLSIDTVDGIPTAVYTRMNLTPRWEAGRAFQRKRMLRRAYKKLVRRWGKPDIVNLRSSLHGYEALALCKREKLPLFFMEHSSYILTEPPGSAAHERLAAVMAAASVNAAVSGAVRDAMAPYGEDVRVIPDPVDGSVFYPLAGLPPEKAFRFRALGQLRPIKGYDVLIRAFAALTSRTERPVTLEIGSSGAQRDRLQALIDSLGVGETCRLVGNIPRADVVRYMNECDCFVCSSRVETLSCVLNEAAACGKPVISTRCGGPEDIVTEETGLLVPVDDPEAMAGAMATMLDAAGDYDPGRIRELTLERFGRRVVTEALVQACEDTVKE